MFYREEHAVEIDRGLPPPIRQRHLGDRRHRDADAGIGNQDVEPTIALLDLGDDFDPARLAGDVLMQKARLAAGLPDAGDHLGPPEFIDIGDRDGSPLARQQFGARRANARCPAGHQCDLALNLPCHFHSLFVYCWMFYLITAGP